MSLSTPTGTAPKGIINQASESVGEHLTTSQDPAAVDDLMVGEQNDQNNRTTTAPSLGVASLNERHLTPNYAAISRKRKKLVAGAPMKTTKMSRKKHVLGVVDEEHTSMGEGVVVVLEPDQTQSMEYLNFIDTNFNREQPSHVSLAFAAQSSVSTLDDNVTPWETTDAQAWQQQPPAVSQQQRRKGGSIQIPSQDQLPAARVGPVHPLQPPHLASILALQQARRIAAEQQYLAANNPLAILNPPYQQHLINDAPTIMQDFLPIRPVVGIPIPTTSPWWSTRTGSPRTRQGLSVPLPPPLPGFPGTAETVFHHLMNFVTAGNILQQQGAGRLLVLPQPHREHIASTVPLQIPCFTIHVAGDLGVATCAPSGASSRETMLTDRPTYTMESVGPNVPISLPTILVQPADEDILSPYQILLRQQIEVFSATSDDADTHARGRNKPIMTGQVGIRCRHCSCIIPMRRKKGAVYFPFALVGLYQAAQNMGQSHFNQNSICSEMPQDVRDEFVDGGVVCKSGMGSGKIYWARSATSIGLVDTTDHGIRFIRDLVASNSD